MKQHSSESHPEPEAQTPIPSDQNGFRGRIVVWAVLSAAWLGFLVLGSVSIISYRYNGFLGRTFREVGNESLLEIWRYQSGHLPEYFNQALLRGVFVSALAILLIGGIYGAWLMLVQGPTKSRREGSRRLRHLSDT